MEKVTYLAVFEPSANGTFGVYFPDLPGCITFGNDFEHAQTMACESLGLHLWGMEKDNEVIPKPAMSPPDNISKGSIVSPITVYPILIKNEMNNKAVKTNVTLPAWLKELGEEKKVNFSQLLQSALKEYLQLTSSKETIIKGKNTRVKDCENIEDLEWNWK